MLKLIPQLMPDEFILQIAQKHIHDLNDNNEYSDQFHYSISKPLEVADGYLFEYEINLLNEDTQWRLEERQLFLYQIMALKSRM